MNQKEKLVEVTTELINEYHGDLNLVTARKIAQRAGVGLGLINYHFGSKEQLITDCVQKIISEQMGVFKPDGSMEGTSIEDDRERLKSWAKQVFEFLYANKSISRISILGDMSGNMAVSNSVYTQLGFEKAIRSNIDDNKKKQMIFVLTSSMQGAFMQDKAVKSRLGFDLTKKKDREHYIESLVDILFNGLSNA